MLKSGRPRSAIKREPSGRPSRRKADVAARELAEQEAAMEVAISARVRMGIPKHLAKAVGTIEAALYASDDLSRDQYDSACFWREVRAKYLNAIAEPHTPRGPSSGVGVFDEEAHVNFCRHARATYSALIDEIQEYQNQVGNSGNLLGALNSLENDSLQGHQVPSLRYALNAIDNFRRKARRR